jgi:DNA invertase Pin-like site-specific DNA recombinase
VPKGSYLIAERLDRLSRQTVHKAVRGLDIVEAGVNVVDLEDGGREYNIRRSTPTASRS